MSERTTRDDRAAAPAPPFVNALRVRPGIIRLPAVSGATVWTVRVQAAEVWDAVRVEAAPETPVRDVKEAAMADLLSDSDKPDEFVVKHGGVEIRDEALSLREAGVHNASTLLVMGRRRRPVR